ncbi:MAG: ferrochelatase [Bacteroidales bacterium]|nr:ferrochelatase [Bacteroidales bacterium]
MKSKSAVVLVNVGTPDNPGVPAVRRYLREFLGDHRVIDLPWASRKILVNLIIVPFRAPRSAALYRKLWTEKGSPLLVIQESLRLRLAASLNGSADVYSAMRYGSPSLYDILGDISIKKYGRVIVVPLYPQYASSTTGSVEDVVEGFIRRQNSKMEVVTASPFYNHPGFIDSFAVRMEASDYRDYDHILFSYHGLPLSHLRKIHPAVDPLQCECERRMPEHGLNCYRAQCYETTRLLEQRLNLKSDQYSVAFQSRLTRNWLTPFADETVKKLAGDGVKRLLVVAPSFVADCLETIIEIGEEYRDMFIASGGEELTLVPGLNDSDRWVEALAGIAMDSLGAAEKT